jgi:DNA-binding NarL/FixJ family response regulator
MTDTIRVLVVDEDRDVRDLTQTFLEREDPAFAVDTAAGGEGALDQLDADGYDAVVSDYRMPGMDGLDLAAAVDERDLEVAFVLFSAADDPETAEAVADAAVDGFVLKGSGTEHYAEIVETVRENLDR